MSMAWLIYSPKLDLFPSFTSVSLTLFYKPELLLTQNFINLVAGGKVSQAAGDSVAAHPSWRKAIQHLILVAGYEPSTPFPVRDVIRRGLTKEVQKLGALVPGFGSYVNEYVHTSLLL
jgi:hypothetical protein